VSESWRQPDEHGRLSPYAVLGLHPSADAWAVKRSYRRLIRELHPDVSDDPETALRAAEVNAAYAILGDPQRCAAFDSDLRNIMMGWTNKSRWWRWRIKWCLQCGRNLSDDLSSPTHRSKRRDSYYRSNACRQKLTGRARRRRRRRGGRSAPEMLIRNTGTGGRYGSAFPGVQLFAGALTIRHGGEGDHTTASRAARAFG
jgi:curved DNA-binding protein CbpA